MMNSCRTRPLVNLPEPSLIHDVYEKTEGYRASDISSFCQVIENAKVIGSRGMRRGAEKNGADDPTMSMKTKGKSSDERDEPTMFMKNKEVIGYNPTMFMKNKGVMDYYPQMRMKTKHIKKRQIA